jgi:ABC-type Co2+ transport system permease subunit
MSAESMGEKKLGPAFSRYLLAGLIAGLVSAVLNNIIYFLLVLLGGHAWALVVAASILIASFLPNLIGAIAYFLLRKITSHARIILSLGVGAFVIVSVLPHLGIGPAPSPALAALPEGFDLVTVPLHIVFGLTAIFLMPRLVTSE